MRYQMPAEVTLKLEPPSWLPGPMQVGKVPSAVAPTVVPVGADGTEAAMASAQASPARAKLARTV